MNQRARCKVRRLSPLISLTLVFVATQASAYSIYNKTGGTRHFVGETCAHCFAGDIADGESKSCPGGNRGCGGETFISMRTGGKCYVPNSPLPIDNYHYCPVPVDAHGWVEFYPDHQCITFTPDGKAKLYERQGMRPVGGTDANGNPIKVDLRESCGPK